MLELKVGRLLELHERLVIEKGFFERAHRELTKQGKGHVDYPARNVQLLTDALEEVVHICKLAGLATTLTAADRSLQVFKRHGPIADGAVVAMDVAGCATAFDHLMDIVSRIRDECSTRLYYQIDSQDVGLLDDNAPAPFGLPAENNFPSSKYDIEEAGKCLALHRWTGCVMHLMRALEAPLAALEADVQVRITKENWGNKIDQIEYAIRQMAAGNHTRAATKNELQWYSEAATHFRHIKDGWRNYAAHGRDTYDEDRARRIYDNVRSFTALLADRLKE